MPLALQSEMNVCVHAPFAATLRLAPLGRVFNELLDRICNRKINDMEKNICIFPVASGLEI